MTADPPPLRFTVHTAPEDTDKVGDLLMDALTNMPTVIDPVVSGSLASGVLHVELTREIDL